MTELELAATAYRAARDKLVAMMHEDATDPTAYRGAQLTAADNELNTARRRLLTAAAGLPPVE